eukprot:TRINITY_DN9513_c0_g1_i1.p1 TRINITY_DN9513_c0_g1~~TRINITY_DN9513_c0_g1_i1.p1  ORF type:complete len:162 (+),score=6.39 TRINITY_DN9513_c0_g1_i1:130-615(+)
MYPYFIPVIVCGSIVWYILSEYVNLQFNRVVHGGSKRSRQEISRRQKIAVLVDSLRAQDTSLSSQTKSILAVIQYEAGRTATFLENFFSYCNWSEPHRTKAVLLVTLVLLFLSFFISFSSQVAIFMLCLFSWNSTPSLLIRRVVSCGSAYIKRRRERRRLI